jgi:cytoskeleton protein RodZ
LKSAREEKGLTYDEVSTALFIRKRVIAAIEAGDWDILPHPVYVRGYVTQYASFLKIQDAVDAVMVPAPPESTPVQTEKRAPTSAQSKKEKASSKAWKPKKKVIGAVAMAVAVVGFFVFQNLPKHAYVSSSARNAESTYRAADVTAPGAAATTATPSEASPYQTVETSANEATDASPNQPAEAGSYDKQEERLVLETKKLTIACQERTWVRIIIDGTEKKEFTLNPEEVVMLNARDRFDLLIGNAAGVKLIYNGKDVGFTGQAGEVKHINLS